MDPGRKTTNPVSENHLRNPDNPEARKDAASELLSPAMPPAGAGAMLDADPRRVNKLKVHVDRMIDPSSGGAVATGH